MDLRVDLERGYEWWKSHCGVTSGKWRKRVKNNGLSNSYSNRSLVFDVLIISLIDFWPFYHVFFCHYRHCHDRTRMSISSQLRFRSDIGSPFIQTKVTMDWHEFRLWNTTTFLSYVHFFVTTSATVFIGKQGDHSCRNLFVDLFYQFT